jgi:hypothetical protein
VGSLSPANTTQSPRVMCASGWIHAREAPAVGGCVLYGSASSPLEEAHGDTVTMDESAWSGSAACGPTHTRPMVSGMTDTAKLWSGAVTVSKTEELRKRLGQKKHQPSRFWKEPSHASGSSFQRVG